MNDRLTLRVSASLTAAIKKLAAKDERSISDYIRRVLTQHVAKELKK